MRELKTLAVVGLGVLACAGARADLIGKIWESPNSGLASNPNVPGSAPSVAPDVTFSVANGMIAFTSITDGGGNLQYGDGNGFNYGANYTIGSFLGTGNATILTGNSQAGNTMNNVLIELVGQVSLVQGQSFTVTHDDGLTFTVAGNPLVNVPQPTAPVQTTVTYNGPTGTFNFDLLYAEVGGPGAVLKLDLPLLPVPEPSTVIAGVLLLLPFGASTLRMMRGKQTA